MLNWHSPFFGCLRNRQIDHLDGGLIAGKQLSAFGGIAYHAVEGFDCVGRVDGLANLRWVFKQGTQIDPMGRP